MDRNGDPGSSWQMPGGVGSANNPSQAPRRLDDNYGLIWRVVVAVVVAVRRLVEATGIQEVLAVRVGK